MQGNGSFATVFEGEQVGITKLDDMILFPGDTNNITMHAGINQLPILQANSKKPYCEGEDFPFQLTGLNVTNNGQNLTYYGVALSENSQVIEIPIGEILLRDLKLPAVCEE